MAPNRTESNVFKHFGVKIINGNNFEKCKTVCSLCKMQLTAACYYSESEEALAKSFRIGYVNRV